MVKPIYSTLLGGFSATILVAMMCVQMTSAAVDEPRSQYVYKTIGQRELKADVLYPSDWKVTDKRAAIVFFAGGDMAFRRNKAVRAASRLFRQTGHGDSACGVSGQYQGCRQT